MKPLLITEVTKSVNPTPTLLATVHVEDWALLSVEFKNTDGSQTLAVEIRRRCSRTGDYSVSTLSDLSSIGPGVTLAVDIDVRGTVDVQFWGTASGIGLDTRFAGLLAGAL